MIYITERIYAMDIKEKLQDLVESVTKKLKEDPSLLASFKRNPSRSSKK